jgi:hypothetical protein
VVVVVLVAKLPMHNLVVLVVALLKQGQVVLVRLIKVLLAGQVTQVVLVLLAAAVLAQLVLLEVVQIEMVRIDMVTVVLV